jgi:hypothetical protein
MANGRCTKTHPGRHWVAGIPALVPYSGMTVRKVRKFYGSSKKAQGISGAFLMFNFKLKVISFIEN